MSQRLAYALSLFAALSGFVLIWIGIDQHMTIVASIGGILFGGGLMHGAFGRP